MLLSNKNNVSSKNLTSTKASRKFAPAFCASDLNSVLFVAFFLDYETLYLCQITPVIINGTISMFHSESKEVGSNAMELFLKWNKYFFALAPKKDLALKSV